MKKIMCLTAFALSLAIGQAPLAYAHEMCGDHGARVEKLVEKLSEKLHLTAEQHTKIKAIRAETKQKLEPIHQEMRAVREKINEAFKSDDLTAMKQRSFINEEKDVVGSVLKIRMEERVAIGKVLTVEQRAKLVELAKKWKEKHLNKKHHA